MPKTLFSIAEVSALSGVAAHRIHYAITRKIIKSPVQLNGRRCFTPSDLERIRQHFGVQGLSALDTEKSMFTP